MARPSVWIGSCSFLADRGAVAGLSEAKRLPARVAVGRGGFPVHPPAPPDHIVPDSASRDATHESPGQRPSAGGDGQPAPAGAGLPGGSGGGPRRVLDPSSVARGALVVAF